MATATTVEPEALKAEETLSPEVHRVKAARELGVGHKTASGFTADLIVPWVGLPSWAALGRFVRVSNVENGRNCIAIVLEVGPLRTQDNDYVFGAARPEMEGHRNEHKHVGITLGAAVCKSLGMLANTEVVWEFLAE